jgi:hypothetical protein
MSCLKNLLILSLFLFLFSCSNKTNNTIDLSGDWEVALDSLNTGIAEKWQERSFLDKIHLPGTLCEGGYGTPCNEKPRMEKEAFLNLKRKFDYVGIAWYNKEVTIPENWENKDIALTLERVLWESQVWVNGEKINQINESLSAPHSYNLTDYLKPGKNKISIRIDNNKKYDISWDNDVAHAYTNETQTKWNGILGKIELEAKDKVRIEQISLFPDVDNSSVRVKIDIVNNSGENPTGELAFYLKDSKGKQLEKKTIAYTENEIQFDYPIENPLLWDEFTTNLYEAVATLHAGANQSTKTSVFGMRKLTNENAQLQINGRRTFMRGTLECCIFPLKGYPAMSVSEWEKIFHSAKDYGMNHIRFHSWCPPEAAFEAADKTGIYLQIELPYWHTNAGQDSLAIDFLYAEGDRIIKEYGNHPSFCFWSMGNELSGDFAVLDQLMMSFKNRDPRHLYTSTSFTFKYDFDNWPEKNDDYWIVQWTSKGWVRGQGIFDDYPVTFNVDYSSAVDSLSIPTITHEIGQYSVYPNLKEIDKYTGNLIPINFMSVRQDLEEKGMLDLADDYLHSTGKLATLLYKEEIERALKTPGFSGFQLLDLHDFPGQSTALVGVLDAFWDSKGFVSAEEFRAFCSPVVPLTRFDKATYTNNETFAVEAEIANFSAGTLEKVTPVWKLTHSDGTIAAEGELPQQDVPVGNALSLGKFSVPLSFMEKAGKLTLSLALKNTAYSNSWDIWVYPAALNIDYGDIVYTQSFDEAKKALAKGATVLLNPQNEDLEGLEGKFTPVFWGPVHFPRQAGTMGILCDPQHPVFRDFPTDTYSNWQWWDICKHGETLELDSLGVKTPLIRMVDNFYKNRHLGLLFEAKSGNGNLLFCASDLKLNRENRPVAKQLLYSLINYMKSSDFKPQQEISFDRIEKQLKDPERKPRQKLWIYG